MTHEITRRALEYEDASWVASEGYIIVWQEVLSYSENPASYYWGQGGGWTSVRHAEVFPSYKAARDDVTKLKQTASTRGKRPNKFNPPIPDRDIRIVKVIIQPPILVVEDMPFDVLGELAKLHPGSVEAIQAPLGSSPAEL